MQLNIRIIEAKDIAKMDTFGKTDAYCQFGMNGKMEKKTSVIQNSMTPKWNEDYMFTIANPTSDFLHLVMKDKDVVNDDLMGILDIYMSSLPVGVVVDHWYALQPAEKVKKGGLLHLLVHLSRASAPAFKSIPEAPIPLIPLKLHIRLIEAKEIAKMDTFGKTDAYCVMTISGAQQQRSKTIKNSMLPKWNQDFHFDISDPQNGVLKILMRDEDIKNDDDMATWEYPIRFMPFCTSSDQWVIMSAVPKVPKGGRLHICLHLAPADYEPFISRPPPTGVAAQSAPPANYGAPPGSYGAPPPGYPPQGYPQQPPPGYPPQGYPQQPPSGGYPQQPPPGYPPQGYPQQPPSGGYPPQGYPQQPPPGYPPQGYPQQPPGYPPQGYPPQGYPPQGYPPQGYPPR